MVLAAYRTGAYNVLLLLHIVAIVVAFAPAVIHPVMGAQAEKDGEPTLGIISGYMARNSQRIHFPALVVAGLLGLGMIFSSDDVFGFGDAWVSLALLVWFALCGVVSGVLVPAEKKVAKGDTSARRQVQMGGQIATVLVLVQLYLMIWKPGS